MNNTELVSKLKSLVLEERKITADILNYLREVESRKLYAYMGYSSLFEFCLKELNYSEGAAQRRISAMRLIKEIPQVEEKIVSGALSLSVASQAQSFFNSKNRQNKPMAKNEKINLLALLENTSRRECEKTLLRLEPAMISKDKERYVGPEILEIKITVDREFIKNLETLKNQLSHKMPFATTKDIISFALESLMEKHTFKSRNSNFARASDGASDCANYKAARQGFDEKLISKTPPKTSSSNPPPAAAVQEQLNSRDFSDRRSRYISVHIKRSIWAKGDGQCQYTNPETGRRCESRRFLEFDHIVPKAHGGSNQNENLQLLCDTHNRLKGAHVRPVFAT